MKTNSDNTKSRGCSHAPFARRTIAIAGGLMTCLLLGSCGVNGRGTPSGGIQGQQYSLPLGGGGQAKFRLVATKFNGAHQTVEPGSLREKAIRDALGEFATRVGRKGGDRTSGASFDVTFDGLYDGKMGRAFTEGFLTGALTLGVAGHVIPGTCGYTAQNSVLVRRADGASRTFSAASEKIEGKYDRNISNSAGTTVVALQRQTDRQCFEQIATQISTSGFLK